jgi:hypothetical protein
VLINNNSCDCRCVSDRLVLIYLYVNLFVFGVTIPITKFPLFRLTNVNIWLILSIFTINFVLYATGCIASTVCGVALPNVQR